MAWPDDETTGETKEAPEGAPAQSARAPATARDAIGAQVQAPTPAPRAEKTQTAPAAQASRPRGGTPSQQGALDTLAQHYAAITPAAPAAQGKPSARKEAQQGPGPKNAGARTPDRTGIAAQAGRFMEGKDLGPAHYGRAPAHYAAGPTGFVGFGQTYGANAKAAQDAARSLVSGVRDRAQGAYDELYDRYGAFEGDVARAARGATRSGEYEGSRALDLGGLPGEFQQSADEVAAMGRGAGGVQALRPRTSRFGAGLVAAAGRPQMDRLNAVYGNIGTALDQVAGDAANYAAQREERALGAYQQGLAEQQALVDRYASGHSDDPYIRDANGNIIGERGGPTAAQDGDADLL